VAKRIEVTLIGNASSLKRALNDAGGAVSGLESKLATFAKRGLLAGTAAMGALGYSSAKAAIDFESSFAGIRKTVDATEPQFAALERGIRNMAKEIPAGVNQLNEIGEMAGQLGIKRKAIIPFIRTIADLGETTNLVGEEAASTMARLVNVTGLPQSQIRRLGSTIVALGNAGASTEQEIAAFGLRIAGAGRQVGLTAPQILSFGNALSSVGIEADAGGTAISTTFIKIASAVNSGGKDLAAFAKVAGMSGDQFRTAFRDNAAMATVEFIEGLAKLKQRGGDVFGTLDNLGLGGIRVRDALLRASGAGDLLRDSIELGNRAWKENTALTREAEKRYQTHAAQLKTLHNRWIDLKIVLGEAMLPTLARVMKSIVGFAERLGAAATVEAKLRVVWSAVEDNFDQLWATVKAQVQEKFLGRREAVVVEGGRIEWRNVEPDVQINWSAVKDRIVANFRANNPFAQGGATDEINRMIGEGLRRAFTLENMGEVARAFNNALWNAVVSGTRGLGARINSALAAEFRRLTTGDLASLGDRINAALRSAGASAFRGASAIGDRINAGIRSGLSAVADTVRRALGRITGTLWSVARESFGNAISIGSSIIRGIISGLAGLVAEVGAAIASKVRAAVDWARANVGSTAEQYTHRTIGVPMGRGIITGFLLGTADLPEKIRDKVRKSLEAARQEVERAQGMFETAFGRVSDRIRRAFDAETSGTMTPAEKAIAAIEKRREEERMAEAITDAQNELTKAIKEGDAAAIASAERRLAIAKEDLEIANLRTQAARERLEWEAKRENLGQQLEDALDFAESLGKRGQVGKMRAFLKRIFESFGIDAETAGVNLGDAFVKGLVAQEAVAEKAAKAIRAAIERGLGVGTGIVVQVAPATAGPSTFAPRASTVNRPAGGGDINITFPNYVGDRRELEEEIRAALSRTQNRQGFF
jgi:TP901 family phage tail tape measure protein